MRVTAERDGPDYTGRVIIWASENDMGVDPMDGESGDEWGVEMKLENFAAAGLFGKLGEVLKEIEANAPIP